MSQQKNLTATQSIRIETSASKVWEALTDPDLISKYFFGTRVTTDWKQGSPITYTGTWEGKAYEDKGVITKIVPGKTLESTYWSSMSGTEDSPEHYALITYELTEENGGTTLLVTQDHCGSEESRVHSEKNWGLILDGVKQLLES